ncbi:MAG: kelch repeat-containing protein [Rhodothermales bacterium]
MGWIQNAYQYVVIVVAVLVVIVQLFQSTTEERMAAWTSESPSSIARTEGAGAVYEGKLFVVAGFARDVIATHVSEMYDPTSDRWSFLAPIPRAVSHVGAALVDGRIWIVGGFEGDHPGPAVDIVQIYDIATDIWTVGPSLPSPRASGTLALLGRNLHYVGGLLPDRQTDIGDHLVLDVDRPENGWTAAAPLPQPRNHLSSGVFEGKLYAVGGQFGHDGGRTLSAHIHVYDFASDTWSRKANLPLRRSHAEASTFFYNRQLIMAGGVGPGPNRTASLDLMTAYDPRSDSWSELDVLPEKLLGPEVRVINERFVAANGSIGLSGNAQTSTWSRPAEPERPDTLGFWPRSFNLQLEKGQKDAIGVLLWTHRGDPDFEVGPLNFPDWITLTDAAPERASPSGARINLRIDSSRLEEGVHTATITATAGGFPGASFSITLNVAPDPISSATEPHTNLSGTHLATNYPNPFYGVTTIPFTMDRQGQATIFVYNVLGERVAVLENVSAAIGTRHIDFHAGNLPAGLYLYELRTEGFRDHRWMTLVR